MEVSNDAEWERRFAGLSAEVEELRSGADAAKDRADVAERRADDAERRADAASDRADAVDLRFDRGDARADKAEARADTHDARMGALEGRLDIDERLLAGLREDVVVDRDQVRQVDNLKKALRSARVIGAAMGIVMAHRHCAEEEAFAILSKASQESNRKLRLLAEDLVRTGDTSELPTV